MVLVERREAGRADRPVLHAGHGSPLVLLEAAGMLQAEAKRARLK